MATEKIKLRKWLQDETAVILMEKIFEVSQIADDFVDNDKPIDRNAEMCRLLHLTMVEIPANPVFMRYQGFIAPVISSAIMQWCASNRLSDSMIEEVRRYAWAIRDAGESVLIAIATAMHGVEAGARVAVECGEHFRVNHDAETFEDWQGSLNK
jgi:hypothetical protein